MPTVDKAAVWPDVLRKCGAQDKGLAEIAAHAAFRRTLYDHDVVPDAQAAAMALA